jgi:hypothetical protein
MIWRVGLVGAFDEITAFERVGMTPMSNRAATPRGGYFSDTIPLFAAGHSPRNDPRQIVTLQAGNL